MHGSMKQGCWMGLSIGFAGIVRRRRRMREEFERLPEIAKRIKLHDMKFCEKGNLYYTNIGSYVAAGYVTGAWYAFQERQKKLDAVLSLVEDAQDGHYGLTSEGGDIDLFAKEVKELLK